MMPAVRATVAFWNHSGTRGLGRSAVEGIAVAAYLPTNGDGARLPGYPTNRGWGARFAAVAFMPLREIYVLYQQIFLASGSVPS